MESLNNFKSNPDTPPFSQNMIVLLNALACFLPSEQKINIQIITKMLELMNLIQSKKNIQISNNLCRPNLDDVMDELRCKTTEQNADAYKQILSVIELYQKYNQMKELMSAINEMNNTSSNPENGPNVSNNNTMNFDMVSNWFQGLNLTPDILKSILPADKQELFDILMQSISPENKPTDNKPTDNNAINKDNPDTATDNPINKSYKENDVNIENNINN